jgi:hypothetical protein
MKYFRRYFILFVITIALLSVLIVAGGQLEFPGQVGPHFDAKVDMTHRDGIAAEQPQLVLLGDSMAEENVDTPALSEALGQTVYTISYPGSASALWYLSIKNNITQSPYKPKALIILFRDTTLTTPEYRVSALEEIDSLAGPDEQTLIQRAYIDFMNPLEKSAKKYFPLYGFSPEIRSGVDYLNRYLAPHFLLRCGKRCVDTGFLNIFSFRTMAAPAVNDPIGQAESILYTDQALDFYGQVEHSFLPEMIRLCSENGIQLILVRGKTISFADIPEPAGLQGYIRDLQAYLTENGVLFADLEPDPRLDTSDYIDRFHVIPEARETYTQMMLDALHSLSVFKPK